MSTSTIIADETTDLGNDFSTKRRELILDERYIPPEEKATKDETTPEGKIKKQAWVYFGKKEYDEAIKCAREVLKNKEDAETYYLIGYCFKEKRNWDEAIKWSEKAIELDGGWAFRAYINVGNAYSEKGDYDRTISSYLKSVELKPDFATAYGNLGWIYTKLDNNDAGLFYSKKAIALNPNLHWVYTNIGWVYNNLEQYDKAIEHLNKAIEFKPDDATAYGNLGFAYLRLKQYDNSIEYSKKALELEPEMVWVYENLALAYFYNGNLFKAEPNFKKAIELNPNDKNTGELKKISRYIASQKKIFECFLGFASAIFLIAVFLFCVLIREIKRQRRRRHIK